MLRISVVIFFFVFSHFAWSGNVYCVGKIDDWELHRHGSLYVDGSWNKSDESQKICSIYGTFDGVSAEICKVWISTIMSASARQSTVKVKYSDMTSCKASDLGVWSDTVKAPEYIRSYRD